MKNHIAVIAFLVFALSLQLTAQSKSTNAGMVKIEVLGLTCPFCAYGLEKNLRSEIEDLENLSIDFKNGLVTFNFSKGNKPSEDKLNKIVENVGFEVHKIIYFYKKNKR